MPAQKECHLEQAPANTYDIHNNICCSDLLSYADTRQHFKKDTRNRTDTHRPLLHLLQQEDQDRHYSSMAGGSRHIERHHGRFLRHAGTARRAVFHIIRAHEGMLYGNDTDVFLHRKCDDDHSTCLQRLRHRGRRQGIRHRPRRPGPRTTARRMDIQKDTGQDIPIPCLLIHWHKRSIYFLYCLSYMNNRVI